MEDYKVLLLTLLEKLIKDQKSKKPGEILEKVTETTSSLTLRSCESWYVKSIDCHRHRESPLVTTAVPVWGTPYSFPVGFDYDFSIQDERFAFITIVLLPLNDIIVSLKHKTVVLGVPLDLDQAARLNLLSCFQKQVTGLVCAVAASIDTDTTPYLVKEFSEPICGHILRGAWFLRTKTLPVYIEENPKENPKRKLKLLSIKTFESLKEKVTSVSDVSSELDVMQIIVKMICIINNKEIVSVTQSHFDDLVRSSRDLISPLTGGGEVTDS